MKWRGFDRELSRAHVLLVLRTGARVVLAYPATQMAAETPVVESCECHQAPQGCCITAT